MSDNTVNDTLISSAMALVASTKEEMKAKGNNITLTPKRQLMDDCKRIEKLLEKIKKAEKKGKDTDDLYDKLASAITCLETTSSNILG